MGGNCASNTWDLVGPLRFKLHRVKARKGVLGGKLAGFFFLFVCLFWLFVFFCFFVCSINNPQIVVAHNFC